MGSPVVLTYARPLRSQISEDLSDSLKFVQVLATPSFGGLREVGAHREKKQKK
jgi:hypothetical protein